MPPRKTTTLEASAGQDEANYGTERFPVNPITHEVDVPSEAADALISIGMFKSTEVATPAPDGMVRVKHPEGCGCSYGGTTYEPEADGSVLVPAGAVTALAAHGFVGVEQQA